LASVCGILLNLAAYFETGFQCCLVPVELLEWSKDLRRVSPAHMPSLPLSAADLLGWARQKDRSVPFNRLSSPQRKGEAPCPTCPVGLVLYSRKSSFKEDTLALWGLSQDSGLFIAC
jgi:hypothetical protein